MDSTYTFKTFTLKSRAGNALVAFHSHCVGHSVLQVEATCRILGQDLKLLLSVMEESR